MRQRQLQSLLDFQTQIIEKIALETDLSSCLQAIARDIEAFLNDSHLQCSILLLEDNKLFLGAAPSLPPAYCVAINGTEIGAAVGSCGAAVAQGKEVIVSDIASSPLWKDHREEALRHDLKACWSRPIVSSSGAMLGAFAIYFSETRKPTAFYREVLEHFCHLASLAIEKHQAANREATLLCQLKQAHEKLNSLLALLPELLIVLDENGRYVDIYGGDQSLLNRNAERMLGLQVKDIWPPVMADKIMQVVRSTLDSNRVSRFEHSLVSEQGPRIIENRTVVVKHYNTADPGKRHVLWMVRDITDQKRAQKQIEQLAFYDSLTELPNRRLLMNRTQKVIGRVAREQLYGALIYIDLNDFKRINDSLGHYVGDELLMSVSHRLQESIREVDTIARIGGDEFVVLLEALRSTEAEIAEEARLISERILENLDEHFELSGGRYKIGASIGIAVIDQAETDAIEVLKHADAAMYEAKKNSRESICFHNARLQEALDQRIRIESEINDALDHMAFHAFFQPQLDLEGHLIAAEALIRWHHPERGFIAPDTFIPIAERMGVIHRMQQVVLTQACQTLKILELNRGLSDDFRIAINICPSQLKQKDLPDTLMKTLNNFDLPPSRFILEITEGMLIEDLDRTIELLETLRDLGFKISIDDFGTGYSSLSYLNQLPVNEIKIDRSFIETINEEPSTQGIIDTVVSLSNYMHFDVIAEGIEETTQLDVIRTKKVKGLQGYLFARPMNQAQFVDYVAAA